MKLVLESLVNKANLVHNFS